MPFWSKRRFLFRLTAAAVLVLTLHVLAAYTTLEDQVPLVPAPPPVAPPGKSSSAATDHARGGVVVGPEYHLEEGVRTTPAAPDEPEAGDPESERDEPWAADDAEQQQQQQQQDAVGHDDEGEQEEKQDPDQEELAAQAVQAVMAPDQDKTDKTDKTEKTARYVQAILDPADASVDRLACPALDRARYDHLRAPTGGEHARRTYYFALDLRQVVDLLPRLLGSVVEAARFLGARGAALAVVEGNSDDGTWDVLAALAPALEAAGLRTFLRSEALDPAGSGDRIGSLARLRSLALEPLRNSRNDTARALGLPGADLDYADDAVVVFLNDVAACAEDILELLHQRVIQEADMTCAMDWHHPGGRDHPPLFYDVWISRALSGDLFFDIPRDGSWDKAEALLPFDPDARARYGRGQPFQVFACWNGAAAFAAAPLLPPPPGDGRHPPAAGTPAPAVDFRRVRPGECFQGEPQLFCKDMWAAGRGRIAVVPSVNLEYTDERGRWIKASRGYASEFVARERANATADGEDGAHGDGDGDRDGEEVVPDRIEWRGPPDKVKCMPTWDRQDWLPWNESLV